MTVTKPAAAPVTLSSDASVADMSSNERIKTESQGLFYVSAKGEVHTFLDELEAVGSGEAETLSGEAKEISKFDVEAVTVTVRKPKPIAGVLDYAGVRITRRRADLG